MNGQQAPLPTRGSYELHQATNARQHRRRHLLWGGCIAVVVLALALFVGSLLLDFANLRQSCTATAAACLAHGQLASGDVRRLHELGLSPDFYATYSTVVKSLSALGYLLVAVLLFWRRSGDRLALLAAVSLALFPIVFNDGMINRLPLPWWFPAHVLSVLGFLCLVLLGYLFPDGHFVPGWTRWVAVVALLFWGFDAFFPSASNPFSPSQACGGMIFLGLIGGIIVVQLYRYRRVSSSVQRQQTRWVVYGVSLGWGGYLVLFTISLFFPALFLAGSPGDLLKLTAAYGLVVLPPLAIGLAILRFRLWEIDLLINRTLVYGTLTGILALVYMGLVIGLSALLRSIISQSSGAAIALSTLAIAGLCQPLRSRLQQGIDRRFFRRKYNAARTLAAFSVILRHEVELDQVSEALLAVVQETMQPVHVSLWLRPAAPGRQREQREQKQATVGPFSQPSPAYVVEVNTSNWKRSDAS